MTVKCNLPLPCRTFHRTQRSTLIPLVTIHDDADIDEETYEMVGLFSSTFHNNISQVHWELIMGQRVAYGATSLLLACAGLVLLAAVGYGIVMVGSVWLMVEALQCTYELSMRRERELSRVCIVPDSSSEQPPSSNVLQREWLSNLFQHLVLHCLPGLPTYRTHESVFEKYSASPPLAFFVFLCLCLSYAGRAR